MACSCDNLTALAQRQTALIEKLMGEKKALRELAETVKDVTDGIIPVSEWAKERLQRQAVRVLERTK